MTRVNISDFDTEPPLAPLKCGCVLKLVRVCNGSLSNADVRTISLYCKLSQLLCSMELIHLGKANSPTVSSTAQLHLTVQGLQNQPDIQLQTGPEYLPLSRSDESGEREREKRNSGQDSDGGGGGQQGQQGGLTLSVTANFHALQQKLMRELWLRNSRVISTINN